MSEPLKTFHDTYRLTLAGRRLYQMAMTGGERGENGKIINAYNVDFTGGALGTGAPGAISEIPLLAGLVSTAITVPVKEVYAEDVNHVIALVVTNDGLKQDVMATEAGIFARLVDSKGIEVIPPILYAYAYTDYYEFVPAFRGNNLTYRELKFNTSISLEAEVNVTFDMSGVYATPNDIQNHNDDPDAHGGLLGRGSGYIVSETEPGPGYPLWLKPAGSVSIAEAVGAGGVQPIYVSGVYVGDEPPEDTKTLWARPISE